MKEIDFIQAYYGAISLAYTASTWWLTVSTALVVATYFAAKHIPGWLFATTIALYALTAISAIYELIGYSNMAENYGVHLAALQAPAQSAISQGGGFINATINYAVLVLGSVSAAAFAYVTWRGARKAAASEHEVSSASPNLAKSA